MHEHAQEIQLLQLLTIPGCIWARLPSMKRLLELLPVCTRRARGSIRVAAREGSPRYSQVDSVTHRFMGSHMGSSGQPTPPPTGPADELEREAGRLRFPCCAPSTAAIS